MTELIGDVTYIGDDGADVIQNRQPSFPKRKDVYELQTATVTYDGSPSNVKAFVDSLVIGEALIYLDEAGNTVMHVGMLLQSASINEHPWQSEAVLSYIGYIGELPVVEVKDSLATANVSTSVTTTSDPPDTLTLSIEYKAARTTYSWFTDSDPDPNIPEFTTVSNTTSPFDEDNHRITKWTIVDGQPGDSIDLDDYIALVSPLGMQTNYENYEIAAIIPGQLWKCSVVVQSVIVGA